MCAISTIKISVDSIECGPNIAHINIAENVSVVESFINLNEGAIHRKPCMPSLPKIFNHNWPMPNPASGLNKVVADKDAESKPYSLAPSDLARVICVMKASNADEIDASHNKDSAFNGFMMFTLRHRFNVSSYQSVRCTDVLVIDCV